MYTRVKQYRHLVSILLAALLIVGLVASASASGKPLHTTLDWRSVVPEGSGDPNGWGDAMVKISSGRSELCYEIQVIFFHSASTERRAAIYKGRAGEIGPVVIDIGLLVPPPDSYTVTGCVKTSSLLLKSIQQNPQGYYVQVTTDTHPDGALRGQLTNSR